MDTAQVAFQLELSGGVTGSALTGNDVTRSNMTGCDVTEEAQTGSGVITLSMFCACPAFFPLFSYYSSSTKCTIGHHRK
jgi:hypothetical protein